MREGDLAEPVDGVVVMRTAEPQAAEIVALPGRPLPGARQRRCPRRRRRAGPVEQSAIPVFQRYRLSTVDGVDTPVGALAMLLVLADPDAAGDYGVRDTADRILPPIEPLPATPGE